MKANKSKLSDRDIFLIFMDTIELGPGDDPCWRWRGSSQNDGPVFNRRFGGELVRIRPQRFLFEYINKTSLDGQYIEQNREICNTRFCVKPGHYKVLGNTKTRREDNQKSELRKIERAKEIIKRAAAGERHADIARFYKLDPSMITMIVNGKRFKNLDRAALKK